MDDIAVVGFSFKLPQDVEDVSSLWETLENRKNLMTNWPESRIKSEAFPPNSQNKLYCRGAHFINDDPGAFDAPFFSITAKEAASMDPMQRWTLETSYRAFENAGIPVESLKGSRTAVFGASMTDDYARMVSQDPENTLRQAITGTFASILPNRVSWFFDLRGPSVHVDTACSSSLLAVDLACQSIRHDEASSALVTGSNLILGPAGFFLLSNLNFLSPESKCYSFDHRANGYARGEGIIAMVLKPMSAALRDGDMIRAVIRSTGSNQDGHTPGMTQPSPEAQEELIRRVYDKANLPFHLTRYIEAHGTGTPVGDPIEMKAIGRVFRLYRSAEAPLYVGSVKANIGHLEGCSGLAGVIKSILILEKGIIPPNALFEKINPAIDVDFYHTEVPTENIVWPNEGLRRVSVNSFGFGGSNTHIILDDAFHYLEDRGIAGNHCTIRVADDATNVKLISNGIDQIMGTIKTNGTLFANGTSGANGKLNFNGTSSSTSGTNGINTPTTVPSIHEPHPHRLLVFNAADSKALKRTFQGYETFFKTKIADNPAKLDQLAFTLAQRRSQMLWRTFSVVPSGDNEDAGKLEAPGSIRTSTDTGLAFVFTGQGAQYVGMGMELLQYPVFEATLRCIDEVYASLGCKWSIFDEFSNRENIDKPEYSQPLSTAVQIALVELLKTFGVVPKAVVGHSSGEIAAAYAIGALSLQSACKASYFRGQLAGKLRTTTSSPRAMVSVNLPESQVSSYLENMNSPQIIESITIACINSPKNCTLAGSESSIDAVKSQLEKDGIFAHKLKTGVAYHSPSMAAIADEYLSLMGSLKPLENDAHNSLKKARSKEPSSIPMVSSVTGQRIRLADLAVARYWVDNMMCPVRFSAAIETLTQRSLWLKIGMVNITDLVEVGPHCTLKRPVLDTLAAAGTSSNNNKKLARYSSVLYRHKPAVQTALELVGTLYCLGHAVSVTAANQHTSEKGPMPFLVDCPEYPFDHSNKYWAESRLGKDFRLREPVTGETLGWSFNDWNPLEPRWRNFLSVETTPWVGDHVVSDTVIYPAAGMIVMALEAVQQICPPSRTISGFYVKEAEFMSPIVVKEAWDDRTETMLHLRPVQNPYEKEATWSDIKIYARSDERWTECFRASVQLQCEESTQVDRGLEAKLEDENVPVESCTRPIDAQVFYKDSAEHGIRYGDWFRLLEDIRWDGKTDAISRVSVSMAKHHTSSIVHPAVLDAAFHALRISTTKGLSNWSPTSIPVRLQDAWFAHSGWLQLYTSSVRYLANSSGEPGQESTVGTIYALADDGSTLCTMKKLTLASVPKEEKGEIAAKKLLYGIEWKPQLRLLDPEQLLLACGANTFVKDERDLIIHHQKLGTLLNLAVFRILKQLSEADREKVPENLRRQLVWMEHHAKQLSGSGAETINTEITDTDLESLLQQIETLHPPWKLFTAVVRHLHPILTGVIDPLEVIFDSNLASIFYVDMFDSICDLRLHKFLELASHENPALRILEVGAGTGGMTSHVLTSLQNLEKQGGGLRFKEYTYTDISLTFFEEAGDKWEKLGLGERIRFKTLDLERSPIDQGFEEGGYDLVIAGSVLHATEDLMATIRNVRKMLKSGGKLVVLEAVAPENVVTNFAFGLVPGWWRCVEEWREMSPAVKEGKWDECLRAGGFSGNDVCFRDYEDDGCHIFSIMITTAGEETFEADSSSGVLLVVDDLSDLQNELAKSIATHLAGAEILSLDQFRATDLTLGTIVVSLLETDKSFLAGISEHNFKGLQDLIKRTGKLLWVTSVSIEDSQYPKYSIVQGLLRSMRSESLEKHIVTLSIESQSETPAEYAHYVIKAFKSAFESSSQELEYIISNGQISSGRVVEDVTLNSTLRSLLHPQLRKKLWLPGPPLALSVHSPGILDTLEFVEDTQHDSELGPQEVEIEAKAWALSFRDVFVALGRLDANEQLGADCAGVVTRVGPSCTSGIQPGDRVCMISLGCMRTCPRAHEAIVLKIPGALSLEAAASIIGPGITAYYAFIDVARLKKGEKILIHSAAGSTGQMAMWIAKLRGAEIFATVGFDEKKQFLVDQFGIPEDHIFYSRNTSFAQGIMRVTKGYGVDVVLNSLSGDGLRASWECVAPYGRFIEIGKVDIKSNSALPMASFAKNVSFSAVDLHHVLESDRELTARLLRNTMALLAAGEIEHPKPLHVYPASQLEQAFRYVQSGRNTGRTVIGVDPSDVVPQRLVERRTWMFDPNASYVVAGGFGGLGRAILRWMAARGAKHLIVPSRSGPASNTASEVVSELTLLGINITTPKCDVSSLASLVSVLQDCSSTMPPIKGCINATMDLQDAIFDSMTHAQWELTLKSKVQSSWNLHHSLPQDLDFFILLSSLSGVCGTIGQSNYAAGCSYQDALARYRVANGQKAVSFDIGWMRNIGIIAETEAYQRNRRNANDMQQIDDQELLALLDIYCDPNNPEQQQNDKKTQLLIGLHHPANFLLESQSPPALFDRPLFASFSHIIAPHSTFSLSNSNSSNPDHSAALHFRQSTDTNERAQIVIRALTAKLARTMSISIDEVELRKPLSSYGVDSLMAVELRNWIGRDFGAQVAVFDIMGGVPIAAVGDLVVAKSSFVGGKGWGVGNRGLYWRIWVAGWEVIRFKIEEDQYWKCDSHLPYYVSSYTCISRNYEGAKHILLNNVTGILTKDLGTTTPRKS
ncbi:fatty acid synthase S-acetyltransferase [Pseudomassariella vexata]|uniref:Fatty acid synthase S-acetyltransferase n=1 Tax=Pseudomassariella vexata TaxID=1141098 RepID=A0A1Y2DGY1_9PEZI|nr:fatty acid synthase S-acetyltransferase [Pseudomassariella vexata]ORY58512.1 fatty acid synthase S-acetyltransferase [Pseudomassariella vexata]